MNLKPIKIAAQYAVGFSIATGFVALLTFIFSFVGTMFCAALTGMMLGAAKCRVWKSFLCSLVFPLVLVSMMHFAKSEISDQRLALLGGVCVASFWLTWVGGAALISMEDKRPKVIPDAATSTAVGALPHSATAASSAVTDVELTLAELQGSWSCRNGAASAETKTMEIEEDKLTLRIGAVDGKVALTATANLRIEGQKPAAALVIYAADAAVLI